MMKHSRAFGLAALLALISPVMTQAATILFTNSIGAGQSFTGATDINPGDDVEFRFNVLQNINIGSFAFSATGNNAGADVADIKFGLVMPLTGAFTTIITSGTSAAGLGFLPGASFMMGDMFSIFFEDGVTNAVGVTVSFRTELAAVPLPATALLLGPFLLAGAGAVIRRRKMGRNAAV